LIPRLSLGSAKSVCDRSDTTTDELESRLEGQAETQSLEFKAACSWDVSKLAKDILALSNVQDGGIILIGVSDSTFSRQGVSEEQKASFKVDIMRDQMASYADPHVNFTVQFPVDRYGKEYIAIRVSQFDQIPVICRRDSNDTRAGTVYFRNRNRRVESAAVSNSYDMRDIIQLATVRMMQSLRQAGFEVNSPHDDRFDEELGGL
jgi:predicted HTH transcriptional regulator